MCPDFRASSRSDLLVSDSSYGKPKSKRQRDREIEIHVDRQQKVRLGNSTGLTVQ